MNLSPARFFPKSTKQHMAAPPHDHTWDISILSKGTFLDEVKKNISRICIYRIQYNKDTKMTSISCNLRKHPLFSQAKITVLYKKLQIRSEDRQVRAGAMFQGHLRQDTAQPHQVGTEDNETNDENKKGWDSTASPQKRRGKKWLSLPTQKNKKATIFQKIQLYKNIWAWVWLRGLPTSDTTILHPSLFTSLKRLSE